MKKVIFAIAFAAMICGCNNKGTTSGGMVDSLTTDTMDTVAEKADTIQLVRSTYNRSGDFADVHIAVDFPVETSQTKAIAQKLWDAFDESVSRSYGDGERFIARYKGSWSNRNAVLGYYGEKLYSSLVKESRDEYNMALADTSYANPEKRQYARDIAFTKTYESADYIVFSCSWYGYAGGAHGGMTNSYYTFSKQTGQRIINVLDPKSVRKLQKEIKKGLAEYLQCKPSEIMENLLLDGSVIPFPSEPPFLTSDGVAFEYRQYEIGPYAIGMPSFTIPYDKVREYMLVPLPNMQ